MFFSAVIYSSTITKCVACSLEITFSFHENILQPFLSVLLCKKSSLYCGIVIQIELLELCGSLRDFGSSHPLGTRKKVLEKSQ